MSDPDAIAAALRQGGLIDITTTGRRSGRPRRIEIVLFSFEDRLYISGLPGRRAWLANLHADPRLTVHLKRGVRADLPAHARIISDEAGATGAARAHHRHLGSERPPRGLRRERSAHRGHPRRAARADRGQYPKAPDRVVLDVYARLRMTLMDARPTDCRACPPNRPVRPGTPTCPPTAPPARGAATCAAGTAVRPTVPSRPSVDAAASGSWVATSRAMRHPVRPCDRRSGSSPALPALPARRSAARRDAVHRRHATSIRDRTARGAAAGSS